MSAARHLGMIDKQFRHASGQSKMTISAMAPVVARIHFRRNEPLNGRWPSVVAQVNDISAMYFA
jgi:hypothetical protein